VTVSVKMGGQEKIVQCKPVVALSILSIQMKKNADTVVKAQVHYVQVTIPLCVLICVYLLFNFYSLS